MHFPRPSSKRINFMNPLKEAIDRIAKLELKEADTTSQAMALLEDRKNARLELENQLKGKFVWATKVDGEVRITII